MELVEPVGALGPVVPVEPVGALGAVVPVEPVGPVRVIEAVGPVEPIEGMGPVGPVRPVGAVDICVCRYPIDPPVLPVVDKTEISMDDPENADDNPDTRLLGSGVLLVNGTISLVDIVLLTGNNDDKSGIMEELPVGNDTDPGLIPNTDKSNVL